MPLGSDAEFRPPIAHEPLSDSENPSAIRPDGRSGGFDSAERTTDEPRATLLDPFATTPDVLKDLEPGWNPDLGAGSNSHTTIVKSETLADDRADPAISGK